ncbi:GntR family transcriptional regulator [Antribacter sp. KLBMP9083]|uniref:GntR family transcriptional regulator n=1 Tax=Antribacter soli TaxID=2910976 RepID=A0AA41QF58_9MICO|nr:GntR family transcriptional regulator [Antribacter soli]MCF4122006.1 GntR family transcriptional regulator [Antribacter soli]
MNGTSRSADHRPRHEQIAAELREQILSGDLAPGAQIPSTAQLVSRFDAANATIQRALRALKDEGFLDSRVGKGVYVRAAHPFVVDVAAYVPPGDGFRYDLLDIATVVPPADVVVALGLADGGEAVRRRRLMLHHGNPVEVSASYYPADLVAGTPLASPGKVPGGAPAVLASLGSPERSFTDRVSARQPTTEEVALLALPDGVPVLRQLRTVLSDNDRPVEVSVLVKGAHLYELQYQQVIPQS